MQPMATRRLAITACIAGAMWLATGFIPQTEAQDATPVSPTVLNHWTQFGPDGGLTARARVNGECPTAVIDDEPLPMTVRATPSGTFTDTVCEIPVPLDAKSASINGEDLALVPTSLATVSIIGDTGCRVWKEKVQDCSDPAVWPYKQVLDSAMAISPNLLIHVGDYIYLEDACDPATFAWCKGMTFGDTTKTWEADFFSPSAAALPQVPWVFLRGNHELCDRQGLGWFRYLAPGPMPETCTDFTDPFLMPILGQRFIVMDTAAVGDTKTTPALNSEFASQFLEVRAIADPGDWLLTHKPIAGGLLDLGKGEQFVTYATIRETADGRLPEDLAAVISGHIHLGQVLQFEATSGYPLQIVVGNSGTALDKGVNGVFTGEVLGATGLVEHAINVAEFGWLSIEQDGGQIIATLRDATGAPVTTMYAGKPK